MQASLSMYAYPHLDSANRLLWGLIKANLRRSGITAPETLSENGEKIGFWKSPDTVFSQTCGMPYRTELHQDVQLVGTPDYCVEGCPPGYYRSLVVKRKGDDRFGLVGFDGARVAVNGFNSQSGFAALVNEIADKNIRFSECVVTGSHKMSVIAVASGTADIASIDAISWRLMYNGEKVTDELAIVCNTNPTPGLPFISSNSFSRNLVRDAVAKAIKELPSSECEVLQIRDLVDIPSDIYMSVPTPVGGEAALLR